MDSEANVLEKLLFKFNFHKCKTSNSKYEFAAPTLFG